MVPHRDDCGGFFVAAFRRSEAVVEQEPAAAPEPNTPAPPEPVVPDSAAASPARSSSYTTVSDAAVLLEPVPATHAVWEALTAFYGLDLS